MFFKRTLLRTQKNQIYSPTREGYEGRAEFLWLNQKLPKGLKHWRECNGAHREAYLNLSFIITLPLQAYFRWIIISQILWVSFIYCGLLVGYTALFKIFLPCPQEPVFVGDKTAILLRTRDVAWFFIMSETQKRATKDIVNMYIYFYECIYILIKFSRIRLLLLICLYKKSILYWLLNWLKYICKKI